MLGNINLEERIKIQALNDKGHSAIEIANYIGRHKSSVYRELSKTGTDGKYDCHYADELTRTKPAALKSLPLYRISKNIID